MDNACSGFGVGEHAGVGQLKRKHEKGYSKTMSLIENEQRHKLLHKISDVSRGMNGPYGLRNITCHMVEKKVRMWIWRRSTLRNITDVSEEMPASALSAVPPKQR